MAESERVRAKLEPVVALWSRVWFPKVILSVTELNRVSGSDGVRVREPSLRTSDRGISVRGSPRARVRLWEWALDRRLTDQALNDLDRDLIDRFEQKMLDDLLTRLEAEFRAPSGSGRQERYAAAGEVVATVSDTSGGVITLGLPVELVLSICRPRATPNRPGGALHKLADALGSTPVEMEVTLGDAELSLSELRDLGEGDVLVLNARVSDKAPIRLTSSGDLVARAHLSEFGDALAAVIVV